MSDAKDFQDIQITTTMPKSWEEERSFNDVLYDWLGRAPYLAVAVVVHLLALFLLNLVPWNLFNEEPVKELTAKIEAPPIEEFEEPPPPEPEEIEEVEIVDPVIVETIVDETVVDDPVEEDMPFDNPNNANTEIGIGGGGGGGTRGGRRGGRAKVKAPVAQAIADGLEWLKDHQNSAGYWDCDNFMVECKKPGQPLSDGPGEALHDVGVTGLALLAFLGYGDTLNDGQYKDVISNGVQWLVKQQQESGLIGEQVGKEYMYNHAIATIALCEAYYTSGKRPLLRAPAQKAINLISRAQNPYSGWRYDMIPNNDNDTSVTGWMVFALAAANSGGLKVDAGGFRGAVSWFDEMTDKTTGRTEYTFQQGGRTSGAARPPHLKDKYPGHLTEALTSIAVLGRIFAANGLDEPLDLSKDGVLMRGADLMRAMPPKWSEDGSTNDMYYWYYGTYAMFQIGDRHWDDWQKAMEREIIPHQRTDGCFKGSWDPNGPWGWSGGRVYSTSLMVLCMEVFFRYAKLTGTR
ncbi:MAG: hypothetical protein GC161_13405 [Planctomycetaceae bacterium]|nr:hypothetical protein [Planctomycetaceae bacterium]